VRQLRGIEREAQEAVLEDPYSRKETQVKTSEGLNEVQGTADLDKMSRPENLMHIMKISRRIFGSTYR